MLAFVNIIYFGYGYRLYELLQNDILFYSIVVIIFLLINLLIFTRKLKTQKKIIYNSIAVIGLFVLFVFPYIRGEKIYNKINCTYELVKQVKEYKKLNGNLPSSLSMVKGSQCDPELNIVHYEIIMKEDYNKGYKGNISEDELLKEDSFIITLRIPELIPMSLKFAGHKKEYYND